MICMVLAILWLPADGISGEREIMAKQPAGKLEAQTPNDNKSRTDSLSKGEPVKPPSQKDVKSRGLFSKKKKKKKSTGGGAAHTESEEPRNLQSDDVQSPSR